MTEKIIVSFGSDNASTKRLPKSRTCCRRLELSVNYLGSEKETFHEDRGLAIFEGHSGFGRI